MLNYKEFTVPQSRPVPVFLLLDVSTSMGEVEDDGTLKRTGQTFFRDGKDWELVEGGTSKMMKMNAAISEMLKTFAGLEKMDKEVRLSIITFGDKAEIFLPPTRCSEITWHDMTADGETVMGEALTTAKRMLEDKSVVLPKSYRPTVILVSDGEPTDNWETALNEFISEGRSAKCDRMAIAIGSADEKVLRKFIEGTENELLYAKDASQITERFKFITQTITKNTVAGIAPPAVKTPTQPPVMPPAQQPGEDKGFEGEKPAAIQPADDIENYW
jgi:uncharacterized protein YegL